MIWDRNQYSVFILQAANWVVNLCDSIQLIYSQI